MVRNIIPCIQKALQELWLYQHGIICIHMVFCRLMGCHTKRSITNAKVAPIDMTLMLLRCIVCILIIINMQFATKGTEQLLTNS